MHTQSLSTLATYLTEKKCSSYELTQHFLKRVNRFDKKLNSFITVDEENALKQAQLADKRLSKKEATSLTGLPIAYKDIFCTKGLKTSCGSKMLDNFIAPYSATIVDKLNTAGMVMLGKTNMDEFAMGSSNETSFYGTVSNPWDLSCVPGGSSGGSAAAISARLIPAAFGTDTGGSIRQPAAFCGITGLKPTYGRLSRFGMVAFASSLDQAGPMATNAKDCALLLQTSAGFDNKDSTSIEHPVPNYLQALEKSIKGTKIGLVKTFFDDNLTDVIKKQVLNTADTLKQLGAQIIEIDLPHLFLSIPCYYIIASAECSSNLSRYDGVRYGYRCDKAQSLEDMYIRSRSEAFGEEVKRRIMVGTYALSAGYFDAYYIKAQKIRRLIRDDYLNAFKKVDILLGPTTPTTAFKKGEKTNPVDMYHADIYTTATNLGGFPALSMPAGFHQGLPIGVQLIGAHFHESLLLNVAHQFQQHTDFHQSIPTDFA